MVKKLNIEFQSIDSDIRETVTKFGGQPVWIDRPQWPISKELGKQMQFICQIALDTSLFPGCAGKEE